MSHIESLVSTKYSALENMSVQHDKCRPLVLIVEDGSEMFEELAVICDFLDFGIERVSADEALLSTLEVRRPMAIVAELDGARQDGCFVLMTVAEHDRALPVLMVTGKDPALAGAVDAVEEVWGLTGVVKSSALPKIGALVDFLFRAGRRSGATGLMPV